MNPPLTCLLSVAALIALLSACGSSNTDKLVITGSSTVAPLTAEIAKRFEAANPGTRIDVQTGGSSRGINDARNHLADIGMASRRLKTHEQDLHAHTLAWDGITLITHSSNPVKQLSRQQISDIYTGKINNWQLLGGHNAQIVVVNKAEGRSTLELFLKHFALNNTAVQADIIIGDNQQGLKTVIGNPHAIAYISIGSAAYEAQHGASIQLLPIDGIAATLNNVESGIFPIARPLNLITTNNDNALAQRFIAFAQSPQVHDLIAQQFFIKAHASQ